MARVASPARSAALLRWGDATFSLALLVVDDRRAAERLASAVLARTLRDDPRTLDLRIYGEILAAARDRRLTFQQRRPLRRHALPSTLVRIAPADRVLLALWLLYSIDAVTLGPLVGLEPAALVHRLAVALRRLDRLGAVAADDHALFEAWLLQLMQLDPRRRRDRDLLAPHGPEHSWQGLVDAARALLHKAVGAARLPAAAAEAIGADLEAPDIGPVPWWQRRPARLGGVVVAVCGLLLLLVVPRAQRPSSAAPAQPSPRQVVQAALIAWGSLPAGDPLHLRVWARPMEDPAGDPQLTELWIAPGSARHRIEVRRGAQLVEWQMGDGQLRLQYAAMPNASSCRWAEPVALDTAVRLYRVDAATQQWALLARLGLGAYGVGAQLLKAAVAADDLRSFGTRVVGPTRLMVLGFTDRQGAYPRQLILWIDPVGHQLHLVQEILGAKAQGASRDLWRLEMRDAAAVPASDPDWKRSTLTPATLLDPACPGLDAARVISVRTLIGGGWGDTAYLPTLLPPEITGAALLSAAPARSEGDPDSIRAVFVGPGRWLRLQTLSSSRTRMPAGVREGAWSLKIDDTTTGLIGTVCRLSTTEQLCGFTAAFEARGFSRDELRALVQTFQPLNAQTWAGFEAQFLDPAPIAADVRAALGRAFTTQAARPGQTLRGALEWRVRVAPEAESPPQPYAVTPELLAPEHLLQTLTIEYGADHVARFRDLSRLLDGRVYMARANDGSVDGVYSNAEGVAQTSYQSDILNVKLPDAPLDMLARPFLAATRAITLTRDGGALLLEQQARDRSDPNALVVAGPLAPWLGDLPPGVVLRRLWLDARSALPLRSTTVHVDGAGRETELDSAVVTALEWLPEPLPASDYTLPPLDPETILVKRTATGMFISSDTLNVHAVPHALVWQDVPGIERQFDSRPTRFGTDPTVSTDPRLEQALSATLPELDVLGQLKVTIYGLADGRGLMVQQGPRGLLRHSLRNAFLRREARVIAPALPLPVTVAGQPRDGWLLDLDGTPTLVVEVDDVLIVITGLSVDALRTDVPPLLAQLAWAGLD